MRKVEILPTRDREVGYSPGKRVFSTIFSAGGILSGKVGMGRCGQDRVHFRRPRFTNDPFFYFKVGLDIGCILAKCLIFDDISLRLPIGYQNVLN